MAPLISVKSLCTLFLVEKATNVNKTHQLLPGIGTAGNTKGGSITVLLTSCLTGLESAVIQLSIFVFICKTD
jgi:hypothetical protein